MAEEKNKCIGKSLCQYCTHNDFKPNLIERCHEKGNQHKDVRHIKRFSVPYNSRQYRSRNKGFGGQ